MALSTPEKNTPLDLDTIRKHVNELEALIVELKNESKDKDVKNVNINKVHTLITALFLKKCSNVISVYFTIFKKILLIKN